MIFLKQRGRSFEMLDNNPLPAFAQWLRRDRLRFYEIQEAKSGGGGGNRTYLSFFERKANRGLDERRGCLSS